MPGWWYARRVRRARRWAPWVAALLLMPFSGLALRWFSLSQSHWTGLSPALVGCAIFMGAVWAFESPRASTTVPAKRWPKLRAMVIAKQERVTINRRSGGSP